MALAPFPFHGQSRNGGGRRYPATNVDELADEIETGLAKSQADLDNAMDKQDVQCLPRALLAGRQI
ncbi:hypothetical protein NKJ06_33840 [Mesorhizobium sp. M0293]|uniref:hypothetical protein n=1 Tax=Mesorhizobium sp. M0293 TaxID=2956930 RepID=UPI00333B0DB0